MPKYFCPFDDYLFYVGPFPDQNYTVEIVGTYRPQSFSPGPSDATFLANYQTYTGAAYPNFQHNDNNLYQPIPARVVDIGQHDLYCGISKEFLEHDGQ